MSRVWWLQFERGEIDFRGGNGEFASRCAEGLSVLLAEGTPRSSKSAAITMVAAFKEPIGQTYRKLGGHLLAHSLLCPKQDG